MYQRLAEHPLSCDLEPVDENVFATLWELFVEIGKFWKNMDDPSPYKLNVYNFVANRIRFESAYHEFYACAHSIITELKDLLGPAQAYEVLFTDKELNIPHSTAKAACVRQKVVNELIALQLSLGGFKTFGAINYQGYIGGAYVPGQPVPYRTSEGAK